MRALTLFAALLLLPAAAAAQPGFSKAFSPNTIGPGSVSTLTFTINNAEQPSATGLAFTDVLPAGITIASPAAAASTCGPNALVSAPDGGGTITFSNGRVSTNSSCTVTVNVTSSTVAVHTNVSGDLTSSEGNSGTATADLTVSSGLPGFTKGFSPSTVPFGGRSRLTFTVDNSLNAAPLTFLSFSDTLPAGMVIASPSNAVATCQNQNPVQFPATFTAPAGGQAISFLVNGFNLDGFRVLPAGATCTVSVDVTGGSVGTLPNVSSDLTTSVSGGSQVSAGKASAVLNVVTGTLQLSKRFTDDPTPAGGTVTLEFTLRNIDRSQTATDIAFTDDLDAVLSGLVATGLPQSNVCGSGSELSGTSVLSLTGGSLASGETCTFSATVQVPAGAAPGTYTNTTSGVTGTIGGSPAAGLAATDDLTIASVPVLTKEFINDPVGPGSPVVLRFGITNTSTTSAATDLAFTDELSTFLPVPVISYVTLPDDGFCGTGSTIVAGPLGPVGSEGLAVSGGELAAGASCSFDVTINIPESFPGGTYPNTTSEITGIVDGLSVTGSPAYDELSVIAAPVLTKAFTNSPVRPGGTATLEFSLQYSDEAPGSATAISFSDDINAVLPGLVATGLPVSACGGTLSTADGGLTVDFASGVLTPGETCAFSVSLDVPGGAAIGTYTNTTSSVTSMVSGFSVTSSPATADLFVTPVTFAKVFTDDPVAPGGSVTLEFTITNTDPSNPVSDLVFTDNLTAVVSGLTSTTGTVNDVCGSGSALQGTTFLIFTGGNLAAGASCTFSATLAVPAGAAPGTYANATSSLSGNGTTLASPATDFLIIADDTPAPPLFSKAFSPEAIELGETSTLTFTIDNTVGTVAADALAFTDAFPEGLVVATPSNKASTCGGMLDAADGSAEANFGGGTVAAGATCTIQVDVTSTDQGTYVNTTGDLTSTLGNSGAATATLTVDLPVAFSATKSDALVVDVDADGIADPGDTIRYTVSIVNSGGRSETETVFDDTLDPNTTLVVGSVTTNEGAVTTGNTPGDATVQINTGVLGAGGTAVISFDATVNDPLPDGLLEICNQGSASGEFGTILTDDPDVVGADDPTCTPTVEPVEPPNVRLRLLSTTRRPARGEAVFMRALATNTESTDTPVRVYFEVTDPTEAVERFEVASFVIAATEAVQVQKIQRIRFILPDDAPDGRYDVELFIAEDVEDGEVYESVEFSFRLLPDPLAGAIGETAAAPPEASLVAAPPEVLALLAPAPNPARGAVTLGYEVPEAGEVSVLVYDALGRVVAEAASGDHAPGRYTSRVDLGALAPGVYVVRLSSGAEALVQRFTVVR